MTDAGSGDFGLSRRALLIANSRYEDPRFRQLASPDADVRGLAAVLEDSEIGGYEVATLTDENWSRARIEIARFCASRKRDDLILIYYSGHTFKDETGVLYLCFKDSDPDILSATGISGAFLIDQISRCRSKRKVLVLDSVYSGSILRGAPDIRGDFVILAAAGPTEYSFESAESQESVFTHYLIEGLRTGAADLDGDGMITFDELLVYAKRNVERQIDSQRPRLFSFAERPIVAAKVARHIFISYSRADKDVASAMRDDFISAGHKAWMDEQGISGGDDWRLRISTAIDEAKAVVAILSPDAFGSTWVRRELNYADKAGKPIFPVVCKQCDLPSWYELQFDELQRLDWTIVDRESAMKALLESIRRSLRMSSATE
ncbi:MAG: caspase, EACC1-associated type [Pseudonocardiaceae bacterium]